MARIRVIAGDSALTPKDNGSYSSRVSFMVGNAALRAAQELKRVLVAAAARKLQALPDAIEWEGERCRVAGTDQVLAFNAVVEAALADTGTLTVKGTWSTPPETQGGKFRGAAVGSTAGFSYAAQVVEVSVDEETGAVKVERVWVAQDCGFAINPLAVEGQVQGAVWMGMGQALCEETRYHEGLPLHASFLEYRVPTSVESPPIEVKVIETHDPLGPFGAKEASEGALHGFPPALTNAICDALGLRLTSSAGLPRPRARSHRRPQAQPAAAQRESREIARSCGGVTMESMRAVRPAHPGHGRRSGRPARSHARRTTARRGHRSRAQAAPSYRRSDRVDRARRRAWLRGARAHRPRTRSGCRDHAAAHRRRRNDRARVPGAGASRRRRSGACASRRGHARGQSLPRHPLRVLQPERMVARRQRLLLEARWRRVPRRAPRASAATPHSPATSRRRCSRSMHRSR